MIEFGHTTTYRPGDLERLLPLLTPRARAYVLRKVGFIVAQTAKQNARAKHAASKHPSAKGGGFWARIADSVSYQMVGTDGVVIGASHVAAAQKEFGGTITAPGKGAGSKRAKALTIPISDRSRGYSVGELKSKYVIFRQGNILFAVLGKGSIEPVYVLVKSVFQRPDRWFPTSPQVFSAVDSAIKFTAGAP